LMRGYYANGFKGMAIEIEVQEADVRRMRYTDDVVGPDATQPTDVQVDAILCNKLKPWKHEDEYRFITDADENLQPIGRITAVVIGTPYPRSLGYHDHEEDDATARISRPRAPSRGYRATEGDTHPYCLDARSPSSDRGGR
jgi:hypothetical protein